MGRLKKGESILGLPSSQYPIKASWENPMQVDLFIDLCVDEVRRHGKNGENLHMHSWSNIEKCFEKKKIFTFSIAQLIDQWNVMKSSYKRWSCLVASSSGCKIWTRAKWTQYVRRNQGSAQFRGRSLSHEEKMKLLFHNEIPLDTESDDSMQSSQMDANANDSPEPPSPNETPLPNDKEIGENHHHSNWNGSASSPIFIDSPPKSSPVEVSLPNGVNCSPTHAPPVESSQIKTHDTNSVNSRASSKEEASLPNDTTTHKKRHTMTTFNKQLERVLSTMKTTHEQEAIIEECNKVLDDMKEVEMGSSLYISACAIFCESRVHRQQWMLLSKKPEEVRINWILMLAKKLGLV